MKDLQFGVSAFGNIKAMPSEMQRIINEDNSHDNYQDDEINFKDEDLDFTQLIKKQTVEDRRQSKLILVSQFTNRQKMSEQTLNQIPMRKQNSSLQTSFSEKEESGKKNQSL